MYFILGDQSWIKKRSGKVESYGTGLANPFTSNIIGVLLIGYKASTQIVSFRKTFSDFVNEQKTANAVEYLGSLH